jgi:excisionase family DNA binding protein
VSTNDSITDSTPTAGAPTDLEALVPEWLTLPEAAERLGVNVSRVRRLLRDGELVAVPRGERGTAHVPAGLLDGGRVLKGLPGTLTVLRDAGYSAVESVRWLFTPDEGLAGTPIEALTENHGTQVRRRARALGF